MNLEQVKQLRKDRNTKIEALTAKIDGIKQNDMYSDDYKQQEIRKLDKEMTALKHDYNSRISTALAELKTEAERAFHNAEYEGLGDQVSIELLKEIRNQEKAEELARSYKGKGELLLDLAQKEVDMNSPYAPAYIKALKKLGGYGEGALETQYKEQNMNSLQRQKKAQLDAVIAEQQAFEIDQAKDNNPLHAAIMAEVYGMK